MAQPNGPGKAMSSRLLTMKFMQRGAAGSSGSSPSTPVEPSPKRQRLSNGSRNSTPSGTPRSDAQLIQEALASEERKRAEALEREAADRGETKWYLSFKEPPATQATHSPLRIVSAGYSTLDATEMDRSSESEDGEGFRPQVVGRRSFGKFNRNLEKQQDPELSSSDSGASASDGEDDGDESDDPTGAKAMIAQTRKEAGEKARAERKAKRKADEADARQMAEDRRKKHVKLNELKSISGAGWGSGRKAQREAERAESLSGRECFKCGKKGHEQKKCPNA